MSANDNAMTRFLFAILQQKCLKDNMSQIDWNKVAHDPILAQEITNGHAARMRYSRFKAAMLGLEPTRRNRTNPNRSRVTKKKKDDKASKKDTARPDSPDQDNIKADASSIKREQLLRHSEDTTAGPSSLLSPKVKEERMFTAPSPLDGHPSSQQPSSQFSSNPTMSEIQSRLHMRLLTPCSDSDVLAGYSPASEMLHSETAPSFDFRGDHHHHAADPVVASQWHHTPYSPFGLGVGVNMGYTPENECFSSAGGAFCDHTGHSHSHTHGPHGGHHGHAGIVVPDELGVHNLMEAHCGHAGQQQQQDGGQGGQVVVKHEEWDARSQGHRYH
ncbi:hypothetical protein QBC34DRAFT_70979 [Podospora aff. communis PSN243]|uniref:Myb-like DNA-binding domain-containing protein n=1 Tax=Podospora aff. communis PSN243 TaxID=3040156 RepID=A0AAV9H950_9PEZI|nr:hypothetical protein QBC34DRAFT_70979 [Podospora aff. communis PSN243]